MAEEAVINGGVNYQAAENFFDPDKSDISISGGAKLTELSQRKEELEREKEELTRANHEMKERIEKLASEIEELRGEQAGMKQNQREVEKEMEQSEEDKKVLESITSRAVDLETEVSRLQHDLITAMNAGDEAVAEVVDLKRVLAEKWDKLEVVEREVEGLRKVRAENEKKVRELERKVGILEVRQMEEKSKKLRIEEEMREKIDQKEREICEFKNNVSALESEVAKNGTELEKCKSEKKDLEETLKESEKKATEFEVKMVELQNQVEETKLVISGMKERIVGPINGIPVEDDCIGFDGAKSRWPMVAAGSVGAIGLAAVVLFVVYSRRR